MVRAFAPDPVDPALVDSLVDLASRAPSAGKSQGWHLVVLEGDDTARFWDVVFPAERRSTFRFQQLFDAPVIALAFADAAAYVERYADDDKAATGLGAGPDAWPAPYWSIDASMAVMVLLLAAHDAGLGALFFAVAHGRDELRASLGVPDRLELLGAIALGYRDTSVPDVPGRSASRPRRTPRDIIHRRHW